MQGILVAADNVTIQGIHFDAASSSPTGLAPAADGGFGVYASTGVQGLAVVDNVFSNLPGGAVYLDGPSSGYFARNTLTDVHSGFSVEGDFTGDFEDNAVNGSLHGALLINGTMTGNVQRNTLNNAGTLNNADIMISIGGDLVGSLTDNVAVNSLMGVFISGNITGDVSYNDFSNNFFFGPCRRPRFTRQP